MSSPYSIALANKQRAVRIDRRRLMGLARSVFELEQVAAAELSVAVVDDARIHAINRKYLNHDEATDVISFLLEGGELVEGRRPPARRRGSGKTIDGEIIISAETALRNAGIYGARPEDELALYLVHGILHLCGYDDLAPREKRLMRRREAEALRAWRA